MSATPSFTGRQAMILHRPDETTDRLARQLRVLGLRVSQQWMRLDLKATPADLVLVDADAGWSGLLPWEPGQSPVPLIALLGSEAPGRIAWALDQGAKALIAKPVAASAVYPVLVMAARLHAEARAYAADRADLEERVKLRPLVHGAVQAIMGTQKIDEAAAYRCLQREAMRRRLALEQVAAGILAGRHSLPEAG
jgi:AmiR/NasT family two-component response regulator